MQEWRDVLQVLVLAIVQGVAEFLPISSDGHLVLSKAMLRQLFQGGIAERSGLAMDIVLHLGTLLAIVIVYWDELLRLTQSFRRCLLVVVATIPAVIIGLTFKDAIEGMNSSPFWAGCGLIVTGLILLVMARGRGGEKRDVDLTITNALFIGCMQAAAILPGVSRSGSTIAAGQQVGLTRLSAATFSFVMAVPVIAGAVTLELKDLVESPPSRGDAWLMALGVVVSFIVGIATLRWLLKIVAGGKLSWFAYYCLAAGALAIALSNVSNGEPAAATTPLPTALPVASTAAETSATTTAEPGATNAPAEPAASQAASSASNVSTDVSK